MHLDETATDRTHRCIHDLFWDGLTRRIDKEHWTDVVHDSKASQMVQYLYVPQADSTAHPAYLTPPTEAMAGEEFKFEQGQKQL